MPSYKAPFINGNLQHYPILRHGETEIEWREIGNFLASMHIESMSRGRSSALIHLKDQDGRTYPMFLTDLVDLLQNGSVVQGYTGWRTWTIRKRGQNYGVALVSC